MTGKNFSANNVAGKRKKSDFYETPYSLTEQFLDAEPFDRSLEVLEPACGAGAITDVLARRGFEKITGYDVETDFLTQSAPVPYLITNPPFSLAKEFILNAKQMVERKIAMLLPLSYLHGKERHDRIYMDRDFPLARVYVFTRYPMLGDPLRPDGKYSTGMMVYAWFVWDRNHIGEPVIRWLDNQPYVLAKGDRDA